MTTFSSVLSITSVILVIVLFLRDFYKLSKKVFNDKEVFNDEE